MGKLRLSDIKRFAQGHTGKKSQIKKNSSVGLSGLKVRGLNVYPPLLCPPRFSDGETEARKGDRAVTCPWSRSRCVRVRAGSQPCARHSQTLFPSARPPGVQGGDPHGKEAHPLLGKAWALYLEVRTGSGCFRERLRGKEQAGQDGRNGVLRGNCPG